MPLDMMYPFSIMHWFSQAQEMQSQKVMTRLINVIESKHSPEVNSILSAEPPSELLTKFAMQLRFITET